MYLHFLKIEKCFNVRSCFSSSDVLQTDPSDQVRPETSLKPNLNSMNQQFINAYFIFSQFKQIHSCACADT